jgi:hypothetical protein
VIDPRLAHLRKRTANGDKDAVDQLVELAGERGDFDELRRLADGGSTDAADVLAELTEERGGDAEQIAVRTICRVGRPLRGRRGAARQALLLIDAAGVVIAGNTQIRPSSTPREALRSPSGPGSFDTLTARAPSPDPERGYGSRRPPPAALEPVGPPIAA